MCEDKEVMRIIDVVSWDVEIDGAIVRAILSIVTLKYKYFQ
jgi:hypothetical protein